MNGYSGLVNAPTGFGKTFSVFLAVIIETLNAGEFQQKKSKDRLQLIWITPLRSLAKDIARAMRETLEELEIDWIVAIRNADTSSGDKVKQKRSMPEILIITPESLHLLLAQKDSSILFKNVKCIVADEWHELLGSKRGVLVELALSRIKSLQGENNKESGLRIWGISATIGNIEQALDVLVPDTFAKRKIVKGNLEKKIQIKSILPDTIETMPWAGHLGLKLAYKLLPIIKKSKTTLIFINTRGQTEMWYQHLLNLQPSLAGQLAIHHGSVDFQLRNWIEDSLHEGKLKAVIATSSLDLGVDFKPVDTVIQVGSPKGVARFLQRAGRSGHSPKAISKIYFLPTNALELLEAAAIKQAAKTNDIESRAPFVMVFDTLIQYLTTLAVGDGFDEKVIYQEIKKTHAFKYIEDQQWNWVMHFISSGGEALGNYPEFKKVIKDEDGLWKIKSRQLALRHRLHIGTIVSDAMLKVKFLSGGYIGMVEEFFITRLKQGDSFRLAGHVLEFIKVKEMTVMVRKSKQQNAISPSWNGGRLPLSANLGALVREKLNKVLVQPQQEEELDAIYPLFLLQEKKSHVPLSDQLLIELINTKDGFHLFAYPFEGRLVHEVLAALVAYRLSRLLPISFSIAMNDYGFELLSETEIPMDEGIAYEVFSPKNLTSDIIASINSTEMARRKFRDIACISGLVFQGFPGKYIANKNLQSSAGLFFNVFSDFDKHNLLLRQAYDEVFYHQLEEPRLAAALERIQNGEIIITRPKGFTPLAFPIKVDSLRESMSSEKLEQRIAKMKAESEKI